MIDGRKRRGGIEHVMVRVDETGEHFRLWVKPAMTMRVRRRIRWLGLVMVEGR